MSEKPEPLRLEEIEATRAAIAERIVETPVLDWRTPALDAHLGRETSVFLKLELLQRTGTFKARGALYNIFSLTDDERARGVTAVSAGNHAIAVAYAASVAGCHAKVVMMQAANPLRVAMCRQYGAEIVQVADVHTAFETVERIKAEEGRVLIHPFEGKRTVLGTSTVGLELCRQVPDLDAVIVPIGGGGLCAGIASAVKAISPGTEVIGVEPEGADSMHRSFAAGSPQSIDKVRSIADSLGAPYAAPYSFALCRDNLDRLVMISDDQMRQAMGLLFEGAKLAVEPAGAAATAALWGPLQNDLRGKRVGIIVCGANIDTATFCREVQNSEE